MSNTVTTFRLNYSGHIYNGMMVNLDDKLFIDPINNHSFIINKYSKIGRPFLSRTDLPTSKNMFKAQYLDTVFFTYNNVKYSLGDLL